MSIPKFNQIHLRQLASVLEGVVSHRELGDIFHQCGLVETRTAQGGGPKWERILRTLDARQEKDGCGNNVGAFIEVVMSPVRYLEKKQDFADTLPRLNQSLSFAGLALGENGKLKAVAKAATLDEATERAGRLRAVLVQRNVHGDVLKFCKAELLQENYFHAVFEATKSVADKIREKSGLGSDGSELVDAAFSIKHPLLAINFLTTETEQSEHKGFAMLLKGVFGTFRNVTAHVPKVKWPIEEQDAMDLLAMVSYLHRRLDRAAKVPQHSVR